MFTRNLREAKSFFSNFHDYSKLVLCVIFSVNRKSARNIKIKTSLRIGSWNATESTQVLRVHNSHIVGCFLNQVFNDDDEVENIRADFHALSSLLSRAASFDDVIGFLPAALFTNKNLVVSVRDLFHKV